MSLCNYESNVYFIVLYQQHIINNMKQERNDILSRINHLGEENRNNRGTSMKIIEYTNTSNLVIEFQDKHKHRVKSYYQNFKSGNVCNPYDKTICGVGYIGVGRHKTGTSKKKNKSYAVWEDMLYRCYNERLREAHLAYADCTVCEDWHNYQVFADWYEENFYTINNGRMHLDKDILVKDNRIYSPKTCMFVPQRINMIFMKKNRKVDSDLQNGIRRCIGGFRSEYNTKYLGTYKTLEEAMYYYNIEKQIHINEVAEEYRDVIPQKLYNALINWNSKLAA